MKIKIAQIDFARMIRRESNLSDNYILPPFGQTLL